MAAEAVCREKLKEKIDALKGKDDREINKLMGFDYYLETKDSFHLNWKAVDHGRLVDAFMAFNRNDAFVVVQFSDGVIEGAETMDIAEVRNNLVLLEKNKGAFAYDEESGIIASYGLLCGDYLAEVMQEIIFFSGKAGPVQAFSDVLAAHKVEHFAPAPIRKVESLKSLMQEVNEEVSSLADTVESVEVRMRKLGRNEPCHCGSGKKYKKCCLEKDMEATGRAKKVPSYY